MECMTAAFQDITDILLFVSQTERRKPHEAHSTECRKECQSLQLSGKCSLLTVPAEALVLL